MSCNVCIEPFNKSTRKHIVCDFCDYSVCKKCCFTYLLSTSQMPHCMNCKREWSRKILANKFPKTFIDKDLKTHREKILFEQERAMLPATQPYVEQAIKRDKMKKELAQKRKLLQQLKYDIAELEYELSKKVKIDNKRQFVRKCPQGDCRGFLSSQWKCGMCDIWACPDCHEIKGMTKDAPHTCKPENIETAKLLAKDTKPCPSCASLIFKTSGCPQMWCIQCHTAFDWRTGQIETGVIHNPEYFRWMREQGNQERNPLDIQCGREIDNNFVRVLSTQTKDKVLLNACRSVIHIRTQEVPRFRVDRVNTNQDLRIKYLRGYIDDKKFKMELQKRDKANVKKHEISGVLGMYMSCATDVLYRFVETSRSKNVRYLRSIVQQQKNELETLKNVTNGFLKDISKVYNCKSYSFDNNFEFS